jgi:hypothetical protein
VAGSEFQLADGGRQIVVLDAVLEQLFLQVLVHSVVVLDPHSVAVPLRVVGVEIPVNQFIVLFEKLFIRFDTRKLRLVRILTPFSRRKRVFRLLGVETGIVHYL